MYTAGKIKARSSVVLADLMINRLLPAERFEEAAVVRNELRERRERCASAGPYVYVYGDDRPVHVLDVDPIYLRASSIYVISPTWQHACDTKHQWERAGGLADH